MTLDLNSIFPEVQRTSGNPPAQGALMGALQVLIPITGASFKYVQDLWIREADGVQRILDDIRRGLTFVHDKWDGDSADQFQQCCEKFCVTLEDEVIGDALGEPRGFRGGARILGNSLDALEHAKRRIFELSELFVDEPESVRGSEPSEVIARMNDGAASMSAELHKCRDRLNGAIAGLKGPDLSWTMPEASRPDRPGRMMFGGQDVSLSGKWFGEDGVSPSRDVAAVPPSIRGYIMEGIRFLREKKNVPRELVNHDDVALIVAHESDGFDHVSENKTDINAQRGTPSLGLMQTIEPTFNAMFPPEQGGDSEGMEIRREELPGGGNITDPRDNVVGGLRYAIERYGGTPGVPGVISVHQGPIEDSRKTYEPY